MSESTSERVLRLKAGREARKAKEKKLTPRQCALALLRRLMMDVPPDKMQIAVFMHKWSMNDRLYLKIAKEYEKARNQYVARIERTLKNVNQTLL